MGWKSVHFYSNSCGSVGIVFIECRACLDVLDRIHLNSHVLEWIGVELKLTYIPIHSNTHGSRWIQVHPNKTCNYSLHTRLGYELP